MNKRKGSLFIITGPSGAGKGSVLSRVLPSLENVFLSVSATTRKPRPGEEDGVNYYFISRERFDEMVERGELPRLGGVLYFTDGYGVFPEHAPDYPVAFVMLRYRYDDINIPRWAMKLVLDAEKPGRDEGWI